MESKATIYPLLVEKINKIESQLEQLSSERKQLLDRLALHLQEKQKEDAPIALSFICTHNSRRSIISQIWAYLAAHFYGIEKFSSFSGGTAVTAFNPRAVAAIERAGFKVEKSGSEDNPTYSVYISDELAPLQCFSKVYDDPFNPSQHFGAIMNCSQADQDCPFIPGAAFRLSLSYEDPKLSDGTPQEAQVYDDKVVEIGTELLYAFQKAGQ